MVAYRCDFKAGDFIDGKFRVEKLLGEGSFGNVYKVLDQYGYPLALKLLRLWDSGTEIHKELVKRFDMEYRIAQMDSKYFVHSFDYGDADGNPYFTMEYCQYGDLSKHRVELQEKLGDIVLGILMGLNDLHRSGMVHRDLKWENVMMKNDGTIALTDFGIVGNKIKGLTDKNLLGKPRQIFGTYAYMSPEQADRKGGGVTYLPTTDIFSFGVMMYEFLTGQLPFGTLETLSDVEPYQEHAKKEKWNRGLLQSIPDGEQWKDILEGCLKADYRKRYQSVIDILHGVPILKSKFIDSGPLSWRGSKKSEKVRRLIVTLGAEPGREYVLSDLLTNNRRMLRLGRELDNDIVLKEMESSYSSRYHCTLEVDKDLYTWCIRDGQWRTEQRRWIPSTNGTFVNNKELSQEERIILNVGDIITIGDLKLLVETI